MKNIDRSEYINKLQNIFANYSFKEDDFNKLIFWGSGATTEMWWDDMMDINLVPQYIVDTKKAYRKYRNYNLIKLDDLMNIEDYIIVVMTTNPYTYQEILSEIKQMDIKVRMVCSCAAIYYWNHRERMEAMLQVLEDEHSLISLVAMLEARVNGTLIEESIVDHRQYFSLHRFSCLNPKEVYIDAGAFVGDTLEQFLFEKFATFDSYYAFEPLKKNYNALEYRVKRLEKEWGIENKIICINSGLDKNSGKQEILSATPVSAQIGNNINKDDAEVIRTVSIDEYFAEKRISTIKADIEGKELDMLKGAEISIKKWRPIMAISIYHKPSDLFQIFEWIKEYGSEYKFSIRCHTANGGDTILYAY